MFYVVIFNTDFVVEELLLTVNLQVFCNGYFWLKITKVKIIWKNSDLNTARIGLKVFGRVLGGNPALNGVTLGLDLVLSQVQLGQGVTLGNPDLGGHQIDTALKKIQIKICYLKTRGIEGSFKNTKKYILICCHNRI